jgi:predicted RNase H-like HicB family nuclease
LQEVITLVFEDMQARGENIPAGPADAVTVSSEPKVAVTV